MTTLAGLVQACKDEPDADELRLILADWLEDHDDPDRAELIRLSLRISKPNVPPAWQAGDHLRMARLRRRTDARWLGEAPRAGLSVGYQRGFVGIRATLRELTDADSVAALAGLSPWTENFVLQPHRRADVAEYANDPITRHFTQLGLKAGSEAASQLASSGCAGHLRGLAFYRAQSAGNATLPLFAPDSGLSGLRALEVQRFLSLKEVQALATAPFAPRLRSLTITRAYLDRRKVQALARLPQLAGLTALNLSGNYDVRGIAEPLAGATHLRHLRILRLDRTMLGDAGVVALAAAPHLGSVRVLTLGEMDSGGITRHLTDVAAQALARSPFLTQLEELDLANQRIGDAGLADLVDSPNVRNLRRLDLSGNPISGAGLRALASARSLEQLEALDLSRCERIGGEDWAAFFASERFPSLRHLVLEGNVLAETALSDLLAGPLAPQLRSLCLTRTDLRTIGLTALATADSLGDLEALEVSAYPDESRALSSLAGADLLARVCWLGVEFPFGMSDAVREFAARDGLPALAFLSLAGTNMPDTVAQALLNSRRREGIFQVTTSRCPRTPGLQEMASDFPEVQRPDWRL